MNQHDTQQPDENQAVPQVGGKEIYSTDKTIRFVSLEVETYAGIVPEDASLVIHFPEDPHMIGVTGDQGKGKTSMLNCLKELLGGDTPPNAINSDKKMKSANVTFESVKNGLTYRAKVTKSSYSLQQITKLEDGQVQTANISSPKEFIRNLIGPVGSNPMDLKEMKAPAQIKWVRDLFKLTPDDLKQEQEIKNGIKKTTEARKSAHREMTRLRSQLVSAGFGSWKASEKTLKHTKLYYDQKAFYTKDVKQRQEEVTTEYDAALKGRDEYNALVSNLDEYKGYQTNIDKEIKELEEKLALARESKVTIDQRVADTEQAIEEQKDALTRFDEAQKAQQKMTEYVTGRTNIENVDKAYTEYDQYDEEAKMQQSKLDDYLSLHKKFVKLYTPEIEGVEICVPSDVDIPEEVRLFKEDNPEATDVEVAEHISKLNPETREGIYYKGRSMAELSESELWEVAMKFWMLMGVKVAFIENVQSLGTNAVEAINYMAKQGCTVFFSAMKRNESFKAEFYDIIPD